MSSETSEEDFTSCFDNCVCGTNELLRSVITNTCTRKASTAVNPGLGEAMNTQLKAIKSESTVKGVHFSDMRAMRSVV